jgi:hypothetical protein
MGIVSYGEKKPSNDIWVHYLGTPREAYPISDTTGHIDVNRKPLQCILTSYDKATGKHAAIKEVNGFVTGASMRERDLGDTGKKITEVFVKFGDNSGNVVVVFNAGNVAAQKFMATLAGLSDETFTQPLQLKPGMMSKEYKKEENTKLIAAGQKAKYDDKVDSYYPNLYIQQGDEREKIALAQYENNNNPIEFCRNCMEVINAKAAYANQVFQQWAAAEAGGEDIHPEDSDDGSDDGSEGGPAMAAPPQR